MLFDSMVGFYHLGLLQPPLEDDPKCAQIYIYDPQLQARYRNMIYDEPLDHELLFEFRHLLDEANPLCKLYKSIRQREILDDLTLHKIVLKGNVRSTSNAERPYDFPTTSTEIAFLLPGDPVCSRPSRYYNRRQERTTQVDL
jgi:hypothetical protein